MKILESNEIGRGIIIEKDGFVFTEKDSYLTESKINAEDFSLDNPYVYCILQKYGVKNRNNRIYPEKILREAVDKYMFHIEGRSAVGSIDHEDDTNVSLRGDSVGLLIVEVFWQGNALIGKIYLPISPAYKKQGIRCCGADDIADYIFNHNIKIGISSRGIGEVKKNGNDTIVTEYDLISWDWVQMPSTYGSWAYKDQKTIEQELASSSVNEQKVEINEEEILPPNLQKLMKYMNM